LPPHEKIVLKNGLTLLVMEKHGVPIVSFSAIVKTGSAADPAGQEGFASVTAGLCERARRDALPSNLQATWISSEAHLIQARTATTPPFPRNF